MSFEKVSTPAFSFEDYWRIVKRRKWWLILTPMIVIPAVIGIGVLQPKVYKASSTILIEPPRVPGEYVMQESLDVRLARIKQQIFRGDLLNPIIEEFGRHQGSTDRHSPGKTVDEVKAAISVDLIKLDTPGGNPQRRSVGSLILSYEAHDPEVAMTVANRLAELFIEENQKRRERYVQSASEFLDAELADLRKKLETQEKDIGDFKREFMGELPDQLAANLRFKEQSEQDLSATIGEMDNAAEQKRLLEQQLLERTSGEANSNTSLEARLAELKRSLVNLRATYKEDYPDVSAKKAEIKVVEELLAQQAETGTPPSTMEAPLSVNPVVRKLQDDLYWVDVKIKKAKARQERLTNLIKQYQDRIDRTPMHEQRLLSLMRDYNNTENSYRALLDKKLKTEISQNIESRTGEEEFRILELATVPRKPIRPDLFKVVLMAIVAGVGAGVGLVAFVEYSDTSFSKSDHLGKVTGLKILCTIPYFTMPKRKPKKTRKTNHAEESGPPSVILDQPKSVMAEQYRLLCAQISRPLPDTAKKIFAFTSAVTDEGKSTTALNVAVSLAHDFRKNTLLIEADLYKPTDGPLSTGQEIGLADVLAAKASLESALIRFPSCNLTVLPRGCVTHLNPVEFLERSGMREFVEELRKRFDYIVIDCPPILPGVSTGLIAEVVDAVVLVVRAERTPRALVLQAIDSLEETKIAGIVFNNVRTFEVPSKYYYPYYSHV